MRRRSNKSAKVPNVKLRPAAETTKRAEPEQDCWVEDTQAENDDDFNFGSCPRPFKGITVCATGVGDKASYYHKAVQLGAATTANFTDKVTHLVAVGHGGAKYNCALERKIPILRPEWLTECYGIWLRGDDVDLDESIEKFRLPIFSDIVLCVSGIEDVDRRVEIHKQVERGGGKYKKALERPVTVTHLLCSGDEVTQKMQYAERFNNNGEAKIHLVWEEWFWDSLEFGGRFDERRYTVRRPRPERKTAPEGTQNAAETPAPGSAPIPSGSGSSSSRHHLATTTKRKHTASDLEEEIASVNRRPTFAAEIGESLLRKRGYAIVGGELLRSPSKSQPMSQGARQSSPTPPPASSPVPVPAAKGKNKKKGKAKGGGGMIEGFRRSNSFAPMSDELGSSHPFRRVKTAGSIPPRPPRALSGNAGGGGSFLSAAVAGPSTLPAVREDDEGGEGEVKRVFEGLTLCALGEADCASVREAVKSCGGKVVSRLIEGEEEVDYYIVRLVTDSKLYADEQDEHLKSRYRTECWLEGCIFQERICAPDEHPSFTPFGVALPVPGASKVNMSFSGLLESEICFTKRLLRALGMNHAERFHRRETTHLFCPSKEGQKYEKAKGEWGIPVVGLEWFWEVRDVGRVPGPEVVGAGAGKKKSEGKKKDKGKGKEWEGNAAGRGEDVCMVDITNGQTPPDAESNLISQPKELSQAPIDGFGLDHDPPLPSSISFGPPGSLLRVGDVGDGPMESTPYDKHRQPPLSSSEGEGMPQSQYAWDKKHTSVASSSTPSPVKSAAASLGKRASSPAIVAGSSPGRMNAGKAAALQKTMSALIVGTKRPSSSDGDDDGAAREEGSGRGAKRMRPQRPTRQKVAPVSEPLGAGMGLTQFSAPEDCYEKLVVDGANGPAATQETESTSVRVMYEDVGQRDARARLLGCFESAGSDAQGSEGSLRKGRSKRMAGF